MTETATLQVFFVEDNELLSFWLRNFLSKVDGIQIVGDASSGVEARQGIEATRPDIALVDIGLPDIDGIQVTRHVKGLLPNLKVIILTASDSEDDIFAALEAGADGYVLKGEESTHLEQAIKSVRAKSVWLDPAIAKLVLNSRRFNPRNKLRGEESHGLPLSEAELARLARLASGGCENGVCLVEPEFVARLRQIKLNQPQ
jgi:DNA-binding NarL/FixJ family response regulator